MTLSAYGVTGVSSHIAQKGTAFVRAFALAMIALMWSAVALPSLALAADVAPTVTDHPDDTTVNSGSNANFSAAASATPAASVQWQISSDGGATYNDLDGEISTTLTLTTVNKAMNGVRVRAIFTNYKGSATTNSALLTVHWAPEAVSPSPTTVNIGQTASFTSSADANPAATVQWQVSTDGGATFNNVPSATLATLSFTAAASDHNNRYRAVWTNSVGSDTSPAAKLTVLQPPVVTTDPTNATVNVGGTANFTAAATGVLTPSVQWQVSTDGGATYNNIPAQIFGTLQLTNVQASQNGNKYRAVFTNAAGTDTSAPATLTVNSAPQITQNPTNQSVQAGNSVGFSAAANGNPTPTVQWQVSTDGGVTFNNIPAATSTSLSFIAAPSHNGNKYRAVFTNSNGSATTTAATVTVTDAPVVTLDPVNDTQMSGATAHFTAAASGLPAPTVQWQLSTDGGGSFNNISGATSTTLTVPSVVPSQNGNQYRAVFTNSAGSDTSAAATLTVLYGPTVLSNPGNLSIPAGTFATFTASANGNPTPTVQWQVSTDNGGTFSNIPSATTTTLSFTALAADNGKKYRAVFTNANGNAVTTSALLTVIVSTTTAISSSTLTPLMNEPVTLTGQVTPSSAFGTMTFKEGATVLCANVTMVSGAATCSASFATAGAHNVTATYNGGGNYAGSVSPALTLTIIDQRVKTVQAIGNFLSLRDDMLLSHGPDNNRQIDRLLAQGDGGGGPGFAQTSSFNAMQTTTSRAFSLGGNAGLGERNLDELLVRSGADARSDAQDTTAGFFPTFGSLRGGKDERGLVNVSFATSLSEVTRYAAGQDQLGARESRTTRFGPRPSKFDVWVEGHLLGFDDDSGGSSSSGHFGVAYIGADYVVKPWLLIGLLGQYDDMRQTSYTANFRTEGWGWMAGPYATARLSPHLFLQGRFAWGQSQNKISPFLTYSDRFDTTRWMLSSTLTGAWSEGAWQFTPSASLAYVEDESEEYLDHFAVLIPSVTTSLGQFAAEPEVSYRHLFSDGTLLEPRVKASAIWNFSSSASTTALGGSIAGPEELRGKIEAGVGIRFNDGVSLDISGNYDGIGSSTYDATGVSASVRVPF